MTPARVTLFAGHYGSGKTNIAVNYAIKMKKEGFDVVIADLDIVNPYFRTKDSEQELKDLGIDLICSEFANTNLDIPSLPQSMYRVVHDASSYAVMDIGGDDAGAVALGRFAPFINEENNYNMFFVANFYRPLTKTPEEAFEVMKEIEAVSSIRFTGIINNSNLGDMTTVDDVENTFVKAEKLSQISGLPLVFTTVEEKLSTQFEWDSTDIFPLTLQKKYY